MSFLCLPQVILSEIYSYDDTFKNIFVIDVLSEIRYKAWNKWRKQFIASLTHELSITFDFVLDYLFDIWSHSLKCENVQDVILLTLWSGDQHYRYCDGEEQFDIGNCTSDGISSIFIHLQGHTFKGFVYNKKKYIDDFVHGYDAMNRSIMIETIYNNESFYLVQYI
jgi:hypothetical protein